MLKDLYFIFNAYRKMKGYYSDQKSVFFHDFQSLSGRAVLREDFLCKFAKGKKVVHFGFLDSPFTEERLLNKKMLHLDLKNVAESVYGIDIDKNALELYRQATSDFENCVADIEDREVINVLNGKTYDIILFPEILEHLMNVGIALENLRQICINCDAQLCLTLPNAYFVGNMFAAIHGNEIVHPDHKYYFSPYTISHLLNQANFLVQDIFFYKSADAKALPGIIYNGIIVLCKPKTIS